MWIKRARHIIGTALCTARDTTGAIRKLRTLYLHQGFEILIDSHRFSHRSHQVFEDSSCDGSWMENAWKCPIYFEVSWEFRIRWGCSIAPFEAFSERFHKFEVPNVTTSLCSWSNRPGAQRRRRNSTGPAPDLASAQLWRMDMQILGERHANMPWIVFLVTRPCNQNDFTLW